MQARIPSLDGFRAIAITLVLGSHLEYARGFPADLQWLMDVFDGVLGVRIFFVLSGFLITSLLLQEVRRHGSISLKHFYIRRVLRIFPIYYAYLLVLAVLTAVGLYSDAATSWAGALTFTRNMVGRGNSATVHFWSLAIEEQFYFVWPVMLSGLALWRRPRLLFALFALVVVAAHALRVHNYGAQGNWEGLARLVGPKSALVYADSLMVGCVAALLQDRARQVPRWLDAPACVALTLSVMVVGQTLLAVSPGPWVNALVPGFEAVAVMHLMWVSAFRSSGLVHRALNQRAVVELGTLSYSLYVWQMMFLSSFLPAFGASPLSDWRLWLIPVVLVSALSYYGLERPVLRLKDRFSRSPAPSPALRDLAPASPATASAASVGSGTA